ncbi:MAG: hypothetical protein KGI67_10895 [Pseudomonadota bacterium]|nr:hypothetical protein [Pseudomonadota bacterium]
MTVPTLMQRVRRTLLMLVVLSIAVIAAYTWFSLHYAYSDGERAGVLQKLSHKGWLCKTWEGELLLTPLAGTLPEKFEFTVPDDAVAARLNALMGKRVTLSYEQHRGVPSTCFGDTEYFVRDAHENAN